MAVVVWDRGNKQVDNLVKQYGLCLASRKCMARRRGIAKVTPDEHTAPAKIIKLNCCTTAYFVGLYKCSFLCTSNKESLGMLELADNIHFLLAR